MKVYAKCPRCGSKDIDQVPMVTVVAGGTINEGEKYWWCNDCDWKYAQVHREPKGDNHE